MSDDSFLIGGKMTELFNRIPVEKRSRILDAAIEVFASNGYENANTNKIAHQAGISVGSLFQYFDNKEDLFRTAVTHGASVLKSILEEIMLGEEDILNKVEKVIRVIQKHSRESGNMIRLYNEMASQSNSRIIIEAVDEIEGVTAKLYTSLIEKAQLEMQARTDCDPKMFAFLLDNIFMMLQFSYACDYHRDRFKLFVSEDIFERDDFVVEQTLKFIKSAFTNKCGKTYE